MQVSKRHGLILRWRENRNDQYKKTWIRIMGIRWFITCRFKAYIKSILYACFGAYLPTLCLQQIQKGCFSLSVSSNKPQSPVSINLKWYIFKNIINAPVIAKAKSVYINLWHIDTSTYKKELFAAKQFSCVYNLRLIW